MLRIGLILAALGFAIPTQAAEIAGLTLSDRIQLGNQNLVLNGAGIRKKAFFKIYVASLYLQEKTNDPNKAILKQNRRIQLNVLRSLSADTLIEALEDGLKDNCTAAELSANKAGIAKLASTMRAFKEVKEGDTITLDFVNNMTVIGFNGSEKGSIEGESFNQCLLKIWLGENAVQSDLKRALLGN